MEIPDKIIRELAKKYNKDIRVIKEIVYSPLKFAKRKITDDVDNRPIRIRYFGVFVQKEHYTKETKRMEKRIRELLKNIQEVTIAMMVLLGYSLPRTTAKDSATRIIREAEKAKDYEKINDIYSAWQEFIK